MSAIDQAERTNTDAQAIRFLTTPGQAGAGLGQAVEIVLALAAWGDDSTVPQKGQVMADGGLALAQSGGQGPDVTLSLGEDQDDLEPGGVADVFEQNGARCGLVETSARLRGRLWACLRPSWGQGCS